MPIRVLPPDVISKIAAGEVIERPASVVKELVENALDAGATEVTVECHEGGLSLIRVSDNGRGIPAEGLALFPHRHATSKIAAITDLEHIQTLGFRGEALASICAVAEVEILTRAADASAGSFLAIRQNAAATIEPRARTSGTTLSVRWLFRNFPARLKFLKAPVTENGHTSTVVTQYALAWPEVKFSLSFDGRLALHTPGSGSLRDAAAEIFGAEAARQMKVIAGEGVTPAVSGLTSPPSLFRTSRNYISFFINRRWVRSPLLLRAVEQAYQPWLTSEKHPLVVVSITIDPAELDLNVHPRKTEVKFRHDPTVFAALEGALKKSLGESGAAPARLGETPFENPELWRRPEASRLPILRILGQLSASYILAEGPDGLYLIDQHAAHERVLFERVTSQLKAKSLEVQGLLEPALATLSGKQEETLAKCGETIARYGFAVESFGPRTQLIRRVPGVLKGADPARSLLDLLDALALGADAPAWEKVMLESLACHGAIKAGQVLNSEEMRALVRQLEATDRPYVCPHGRPAIIHLDSRQLEKQFGRITA
jgi:DNA mismatch repair protein MutL